MGIQSRYFWLNVGSTYPISFRAQGNSDGEDIDAQVEQLTIEPRALNVLMPQDAIIEQPVLQFAQGRITGRLRVHGKVFNPSLDGSLRLQNVRLLLPYSPDTSPALNIEIVAKDHVIMAKPFQVQFPDSQLYSSGYDAAYIRHQSLQIARYYLNFGIRGKQGIPLFYDAYGIQYSATAKGSATLEGSGQGGYLNADFELNQLLMQGSQRYNSIGASGSPADPGRVQPDTNESRVAPTRSPANAGSSTAYPFSLDIRAKIGRSARLSYPQEASPIFTTRLNPRDELRVSYDGDSQKGSLEGHITLYDGQLYLLGNQMNLRKGELIFDEDFAHFSPEISLFFVLYAYDQQEGQNIQVNMDYQGDLDKLAERDWSPHLHSQPPKPEQELRSLVASQLTAGGAVTVEGESNLRQNQFFSGVLSQLGSNVVLKPAEEFIRKEFKFDEVNLKTDLLGNLLNDYLNVSYRFSGRRNNAGFSNASQLQASIDPAASNWVKYLDNTHMSFGSYIDRNNTILLLFNIDLLYKPQDTRAVLFSRDDLQVVPGLGLKFSTPLLDITWDIGLAHYNDFFITDSSLLLEWSLSDFLGRRRLAAFERSDEKVSDEIVPYVEE